MTIPTTPPASDDFLDDELYAAPPASVPTAGAPARRRVPALATAGWLVAGVVAGAVGVAALHSSSSSSVNTTPAAAGGAQPGSGGFAGGPSGSGSGFGGGFGGGGGFNGEQHVLGTLGSVHGNTFTVTTSAGTSTYTVDSSTQLLKNGQPVPSLAAMTVGDQVLVHVYPLNGTTHVERVIDGTPGGAQTT